MVQGGKNSGQHLHQVVYPEFQKLWDNLLAWIDGYLLYAKSPQELLSALRIFFHICRESNFKLNALKFVLFSLEVVRSDRKIKPQGIHFERRGVDGLLDMPRPQTASDLTQITHAEKWLRGAIPDFSCIIAPLKNLLQDCAYLCGSTKKSKLKSVQLEKFWQDVHQNAFDALKKTIADRVSCGNLDKTSRCASSPMLLNCTGPECSRKFQEKSLIFQQKSKTTSHRVLFLGRSKRRS